jgi:hypothetical protein
MEDGCNSEEDNTENAEGKIGDETDIWRLVTGTVKVMGALPAYTRK